MNWRSFTFLDLFAGIGGMRLAFEAVGGKCVFASEIDPHACTTYKEYFGEHPKGDIRTIPSYELPECDILLASLPSILDHGQTRWLCQRNAWHPLF